MKKAIRRVIIMTLLFVLIIYLRVYANNLEYSYELDSNNYATITAYNGISTEITIPNKIDGHEVKKLGNHIFHTQSTNGKDIKKVIISEGITTIGDFAFVQCTNLESVELPESLTSLGEQTFIGCNNLKKINIPSKITKLGYMGSLFQETGLTEFTIHENIQSVGDRTLFACKDLKKVIVYSKDVELGSQVFEYCSNDLVIYGYQDSTIQSYAIANGLTFKNINTLSTDITVETVTLNKTSLSLEIGETETLIATINPINATNNTLTWSSTKKDIAVVDSTGTITAKAEGQTVITVTTGGKSATCTVTVTKKEENKYKGFTTVGTIEIPKINLNYPVLKTISPNALEVSVAILYPRNPVLNSTNNIVIIGHNYKNETMFSRNDELSLGDEIYITGLNNDKITYYIYKIFETNENDTSFYNRETKGKREITLSTITDDGTKRLIILASEKEYENEDEDDTRVEDNTVIHKKLPNTGQVYFLEIVIMNGMIIFTLYHKKQKYKKI